MKKGLFAIAAGLFLLVSCNETKDANNGMSNEAMNKKNVEHHEIVMRAIESGDVSKLDSIISKDAVDHDVMGRDLVGLDSIKYFLGSLHNYFDGLKCEVLQSATSPDGQYFYATVRMTGKAKANPMGMPVGTDMDDTSVDLVKMKDGKAVDHWGFWSNKDVDEMMKGMQMQGGNKPMLDMKKDNM
jgi:predicted SnoaL-like aldol condensation-catalyzing enzyme